MVTFDEFENELWILNPDGDIRKTYDAVCFHIENYYDERDVPITYEKIKQRYAEYLPYHAAKYGNTEERYIPTKERKRNIWQFVTDKFYKRVFHSNVFYPDRDPYLFGENKIEIINKKYNKLKAKIENEREKFK